MKKALITGANRSIGFETARQLLKLGYHVYLGSRSPDRGQQAVEKLKSEGLTAVEAIALDVSSEESVNAARTEIGRMTDTLDVLVNNAGILGGMDQKATASGAALYQEVYNTNVFGIVRVNLAFLDLLKAAEQPRIVNVTSGLGSVSLNADPSWKYYGVKAAVYNSSKAALNMYTIVLAHELRDTAFKVNAVDPGYTATDFNHHSGPGTVAEAAARLVKCATLPNDGPTGQFFSDDNNPETGISPW
jgi:NAD(P)-dependent dehydrogenase (short-subunit alcohol dehydrogenase family)